MSYTGTTHGHSTKKRKPLESSSVARGNQENKALMDCVSNPAEGGARNWTPNTCMDFVHLQNHEYGFVWAPSAKGPSSHETAPILSDLATAESSGMIRNEYTHVGFGKSSN